MKILLLFPLLALLVIPMIDDSYGNFFTLVGDSSVIEIGNPILRIGMGGTVLDAKAPIDGLVQDANGIFHIIEGDVKILGKSFVFFEKGLRVTLTPNDQGVFKMKTLIFEDGSFQKYTEYLNSVDEILQEPKEETEVDEIINETIQEKNLIIISDHTESSEFYQNFMMWGKIYDADINPNPEFFSKTDGLIDDIAVKVSILHDNDKPLFEDNLLTSNGQFETKYLWAYQDTVTDYKVILDVNNGQYIEESVTSYLGYQGTGTDNRPPTADAGTDQTGLDEYIDATPPPSFTIVTLDASASSDPDDDPLVYLWEYIPNGNHTIPLSNTGDIMLTFTSPNIAERDIFEFRLTVTDPSGLFDTDVTSVEILNND